MARQQFYQPQRSSRGTYDEESPDDFPVPSQPNAVSQSASDTLDNIDDVLRDNEESATTGAPTDSQAMSADENAEAEAQAADGSQSENKQDEEDDDTVGNGYNADDNPSLRQKAKNRLWGNRSRQRKSIAGFLVGMLLGGGLFGTSYFAGPFEFIHIAQLMQQFHFASQANAEDDRFMRQVRDAKFIAKNQTERTRLGLLGNKFADGYAKQITDTTGLDSKYSGRIANFDGWVANPATEEFKGKSPADIKAYLSEKYPGATIVDGTGDLKGRVLVQAPKSYGDVVKFNYNTLRESGNGHLSSFIGGRLMAKRQGAISWLHPLKKGDAAALKYASNKATALKEWRSNRGKQIKADVSSPVEAAPDDQDPNETPDDKTAKKGVSDTVAEGEEAGTKAASGDTKAVGGLKTSLGAKITAGGAAAVGVLCTLRGLAEAGAEVKQAQVVKPLIKMSVATMGLGSQVQAGGADVTPEMLDLNSSLLNGTDSNGQQTSWYDAESVQREVGNSNPKVGVPASDTLKTISKGTPFDALKSAPALGAVCSTAGTVVTTIIGLATGPISTAVGFFAGLAAGPTIMKHGAEWLAGQAIDPNAVGADFGNDINYGSVLAANDQAMAAGGSVLSGAQVAELDEANNGLSTSDFQTHNIAYRIFSPSDSRSLLASMIDRQPATFAGALTNVASSIGNFGHLVSSTFGSLVSPRTHAAAPYDYGLPVFGFSESDLNNPTVANPYDNANQVATMLDAAAQPGYTGPNYVQEAHDCFGVDIANTNGQWGVTSQTDESPTYEKIQQNSACSQTGSDWLRLRFFVLDTETMNSMACYAGQSGDQEADQACSDIGFGASGGAVSWLGLPISNQPGLA